MLRRLQKLLRERIEPGLDDAGGGREAALQLATAALLIETARADFASDADEQAAIEALVARHFRLDEAAAAALHEQAASSADRATSLYEFTRELNEHLDPDGKMAVLEMMWRVAMADGRVDAYEQHLIRHVGSLLHVRHAEYIAAKLRVIDDPG